MYECLIVIDGLRTKEEWELIEAALRPRHAEGSLIIVITTDASVAAYCAGNEDHVFGLKGLEAKAAYDLFMKVCFLTKSLPMLCYTPGKH
jgi:hypothetical protein